MIPNTERAEELLGQNFFGVEDWVFRFCAGLTGECRKLVPDFPWDENVLDSPCPFTPNKKIKETHFAYLGLPSLYPCYKNPRYGSLNIYGLYDLLYPRDGVHPNVEGLPKNVLGLMPVHWYPFVEVTCQLRWYLMPLSIPESANKTYDEQVSMLPKEYEVSFAVEEFAKRVLYYAKNGFLISYSEGRSVRCRDLRMQSTKVDLNDPCIEIHADPETGLLRLKHTTCLELTVPVRGRPYVAWGFRNTHSPLTEITASRLPAH